MAFDFFAVVMAILSVLSFGAIGGTDISDETPQIELTGVTDANLQEQPEETSQIENTGVTNTEPEDIEQEYIDTAKPGAHLIAGEWSGTSSIPFMISVEFYADVEGDGTAKFSGSVTSSMFGNHEFDTEAGWEYLGGDSFNTVIYGTDTKVTCSGNKLTFPLNPYQLGLIDDKIADQEFIISLNRI